MPAAVDMAPRIDAAAAAFASLEQRLGRRPNLDEVSARLGWSKTMTGNALRAAADAGRIEPARRGYAPKARPERPAPAASRTIRPRDRPSGAEVEARRARVLEFAAAFAAEKNRLPRPHEVRAVLDDLTPSTIANDLNALRRSGRLMTPGDVVFARRSTYKVDDYPHQTAYFKRTSRTLRWTAEDEQRYRAIPASY